MSVSVIRDLLFVTFVVQPWAHITFDRTRSLVTWPDQWRCVRSFGRSQENAENGEIRNALRHVRPGNNFEPLCEMFAKVEVNGKNEHPVFQVGWQAAFVVCVWGGGRQAHVMFWGVEAGTRGVRAHYVCTAAHRGRIVTELHGRRKRGGTGGRVPRSRKISGGRPPQKLWYFSIFFLDTYENFVFFTIFKIKWPKSEEKLNFGGRWVWVPMNPSPQTKVCGDAPAELQSHGHRWRRLAVLRRLVDYITWVPAAYLPTVCCSLSCPSRQPTSAPGERLGRKTSRLSYVHLLTSVWEGSSVPLRS